MSTYTHKDLKEQGWISLTRAGIILGVRYLKVRDLMTQGHLGEIRETSTGRYYLNREEVERYRDSVSS